MFFYINSTADPTNIVDIKSLSLSTIDPVQNPVEFLNSLEKKEDAFKYFNFMLPSNIFPPLPYQQYVSQSKPLNGKLQYNNINYFYRIDLNGGIYTLQYAGLSLTKVLKTGEIIIQVSKYETRWTAKYVLFTCGNIRYFLYADNLMVLEEKVNNNWKKIQEKQLIPKIDIAPEKPEIKTTNEVNIRETIQIEPQQKIQNNNQDEEIKRENQRLLIDNLILQIQKTETLEDLKSLKYNYRPIFLPIDNFASFDPQDYITKGKKGILKDGSMFSIITETDFELFKNGLVYNKTKNVVTIFQRVVPHRTVYYENKLVTTIGDYEIHLENNDIFILDQNGTKIWQKSYNASGKIPPVAEPILSTKAITDRESTPFTTAIYEPTKQIITQEPPLLNQGVPDTICSFYNTKFNLLVVFQLLVLMLNLLVTKYILIYSCVIGIYLLFIPTIYFINGFTLIIFIYITLLQAVFLIFNFNIIISILLLTLCCLMTIEMAFTPKNFNYQLSL